MSANKKKIYGAFALIASLFFIFSCKSQATEKAVEETEVTAENLIDDGQVYAENFVDDSNAFASKSMASAQSFSEDAEAAAQEAEGTILNVADDVAALLKGNPLYYAGENQTIKFKLNGTCEYWENDGVAKCKFTIDKNVIKLTQVISIEKEGSETWKGSYDIEEYLYLKGDKLYAFALKKDGQSYKHSRMFWFSDKKDGELIGAGKKNLVFKLNSNQKFDVEYDMEFAYNKSTAEEKHITSNGTWSKSGNVVDLGGWGKYFEYGDYLVRDSEYFFIIKKD